MLLRSTAPHINKHSLHREKKDLEKKENVPNQSFLGFASRIASKEVRLRKTHFCVFMDKEGQSALV
jgi:hypothetical protein